MHGPHVQDQPAYRHRRRFSVPPWGVPLFVLLVVLVVVVLAG